MNKNTSSRYIENPFITYALLGLFAISLPCICLKSYSQSYFYSEKQIPTHTESSLTYNTFLTPQNDGRAIARIMCKEPVSGEKKPVEFNFANSATSGINNGEKHFVQQGETLRNGSTSFSSLNSLKYVKRRTETGVASLPEAMVHQHQDGRGPTSEMLVYQRKNHSLVKVQGAPVNSFFNESDKFHQRLFTTPLPAQSRDNRKEKFYLIVVANTLDSIIGASTQTDMANIVSTFSLLAKDANMDIQVEKIVENDLSKQSVELALELLRPSPLDIVVFYFSGHGFRYTKDTSAYPRISLRLKKDADLSKNNISLEDVYKTLVKKKAKLTLVLADCCNDNIDAIIPEGPTFMKTKAPNGEPVLNMTLFKKLFFPSKAGSILIASADKHQLAVGNPNLGGYYTSSFTTELRKVLYDAKANVTWLSILASTKKQASWLSLGAECGANRCVQSARFTLTPKL